MQATSSMTRERKVVLTPGHDKSELKSRMEGVKLRDDTVLVDLQQLVRERVAEEPHRFSRRRR